jgi:hypothetical protein
LIFWNYAATAVFASFEVSVIRQFWRLPPASRAAKKEGRADAAYR